MPVTTTTTTMSSATTSLHTIGWRGPSGICFILVLIATFFYLLGFSTNSWYSNGSNEGLWETCSCFKGDHDQSWFKATQAMITIGLAGLIICLVLGILYMFVHSPMVSKNSVIIALIIVAFVSAAFMLIGLIIYGVERKSPHWSYAMAVIGMLFTLGAGVVAVIQMRQSGVPCC